MSLPTEVEQELVKNIKVWVAKKGHSIEKDKNGKIVIRTKKGGKSKPPLNVFPAKDRLPKAVLDEMESRIKQWAASKGYETGPDKKGNLVGKTPKGKNAKPPFTLFLAELPPSLAGDATAVAPGSASGSAETPDHEEDSADDEE